MVFILVFSFLCSFYSTAISADLLSIEELSKRHNNCVTVLQQNLLDPSAPQAFIQCLEKLEPEVTKRMEANQTALGVLLAITATTTLGAGIARDTFNTPRTVRGVQVAVTGGSVLLALVGAVDYYNAWRLRNLIRKNLHTVKTAQTAK